MLHDRLISFATLHPPPTLLKCKFLVYGKWSINHIITGFILDYILSVLTEVDLLSFLLLPGTCYQLSSYVSHHPALLFVLVWLQNVERPFEGVSLEFFSFLVSVYVSLRYDMLYITSSCGIQRDVLTIRLRYSYHKEKTWTYNPGWLTWIKFFPPFFFHFIELETCTRPSMCKLNKKHCLLSMDIIYRFSI